jgi:glycerol transport system ATP-binding protein
MQGRVSGGRAALGKEIHFPLHGHLSGLSDAASGTAYMFGIRCNHLFLERQHPEDIELAARVVLAEINGSETFIHVSHGDVNLVVQDEGIRPVKIGATLSVFVNPERLFVYNTDGQLVASPVQATH